MENHSFMTRRHRLPIALDRAIKSQAYLFLCLMPVKPFYCCHVLGLQVDTGMPETNHSNFGLL